MEIIVQKTAAEASQKAARIIARLVKEKPNAVLGLATGSTPLALYQELIRMHQEEGLDFSKVRTFNLDEYVGLGGDHPASYRYFMREKFFNHVNIAEENIHIPDGLVTDIPKHSEAYEDAIRAAGGIDLQILGIGSDGHVGFNEPSSSFASRTRIKTLTERTRQDNAAFFSSQEDVPYHVITMGIGTIMESRSCLLLAFGEKKADAIAQTVEGPVRAMVPASILQHHRVAKVLLDEGAASKLSRLEYYHWVYQNKPEWQQDL